MPYSVHRMLLPLSWAYPGETSRFLLLPVLASEQDNHSIELRLGYRSDYQMCLIACSPYLRHDPAQFLSHWEENPKVRSLKSDLKTDTWGRIIFD